MYVLYRLLIKAMARKVLRQNLRSGINFCARVNVLYKQTHSLKWPFRCLDILVSLAVTLGHWGREIRIGSVTHGRNHGQNSIFSLWLAQEKKIEETGMSLWVNKFQTQYWNKFAKNRKRGSLWNSFNGCLNLFSHGETSSLVSFKCNCIKGICSKGEEKIF